MTLNVDKFKAKLKGGGARANMFRVTLNFPAFVSADVELASFMVKAASMPATNIDPIELPFRGRIIKLAGDRTFEPWTLTLLNDVATETRSSLEAWSNGINGMRSNISIDDTALYQADATIEQLNGAGEVTKTYNMRSCWPSNVAAIDVSNDSSNTIQEYIVEMQYDYWEVDGLTT